MTTYQEINAAARSTQDDIKVRYTAKTHTSGGRRGGVSRSDDGRLDVKFSAPGVPGTGTNPEQLFAAGWSACFISAMGVVANKMKVKLPADAAVDAEIDLCNSGDVYFLRARLNVSLPGLEREIAQIGLAALYDRLIAIDPGANTKIHPNDRQRIIRGLEVYQSTGRPLSEWQNEHRFQEEAFQVLKIGLARSRAELYDLINRRSESMIRAGLLGEVRGLMERGYELDLKPLRSVGYRQMGEVIEGIKGLPEAMAEMKQETRRLAKRQLTWFRSDPEIRWFHPEKQEREIGELVQAFLL